MAEGIEFTVNAPPPAYDPSLSILSQRHPRYPLVEKLREEAAKAMRGRRPFARDVSLSLEIEHESSRKPEADAANIIGGVANALEGVVYEDDGQIVEVRYKRVHTGRDFYRVRVRVVEAAAPR